MSQIIDDITKEQFEELEQEYGKLFEVETPIGKVYVRRARKHEFRRCVKKLREGDLGAQDQLCIDCAAYPDRKAMLKYFDMYPALSQPIAEVISDVASGDEESAAKKPSSSSSAEEKTSG